MNHIKTYAFLFISLLMVSANANLHAADEAVSPGDVKFKDWVWSSCLNEWVPECFYCDETTGKWTSISKAGKNGGALQEECEKSTSGQGSTIDIRTGNHIHKATDWSSISKTSGCSSCSGNTNIDVGLQNFSIKRYHMYRLMTHQSSLGAGEFLSWDINLTFYEEPNAHIGVRLFDPARNGEVVLHNRTKIRSYFEGTFRKVDRLNVYDVNGVKLDTKRLDRNTSYGGIERIDTAELVKLDGTTMTFEVFEGQNGTKVGRLINSKDRNGYQTTFSYEEAYDTVLADETKKWKLTNVTDVNGRVLTITYNPTKVANRWAVKDITVPNGTKVEYEYGTVLGSNDYEKLTKVTYPDLTESTIARVADGSFTRIDYFEAGAKGTHRKKSAYMSGSATFAADMVDRESIGDIVMYTQASNIMRFLTNGNDEVAYLIASRNINSGHKRVYEGAGTLRNANLENNNYIKDGWSFDPAAGGEDIDAFTNTVAETQGYDSDKKNARALIPDYANFPDGRKCEYFYDSVRSQKRMTMKVWDKVAGAAGGVSEWRYNDFSQVTAYSDRLGRISLYEYDTNGNLLKKKVGYYGDIDTPTAGPEAAEFTFEYHTVASDANNVNLLRYEFDANLNRVEFIYNSDHQLVEIKEPNDTGSSYHTAQTFTYDSAKRLSSVTDASGRVTTSVYDDCDRIIQTTYHDGSSESATFGSGADSNMVITKTDRDGNTTELDYDASGRVIQSTVGANAAAADQKQIITLTYLPGTNRVLTKTTNGEVLEYDYDYRKRLVGTTVYPKNGTALTTTSTVVDNLLFCKTDAYNRKTYYGYRASDKALVRTVQGTTSAFSLADFAAVSALTRDLSNNAAYVITDISLDLVGQTTTTTDGRGTTHTSVYDLRGRNTSSTEAASDLSVAATTSSTFDANSNLTSRVNARNIETQMTYTRRNKLASEIVAYGTTNQATRSMTYLNDGRIDEQFDFNNNRTKTLWHGCCGRVQANVDARGAGMVSNNSYEGDITHLINVKDIYDYDTNTVLVGNFHDIDAASTISEITKQYDERHRLIAQTNWLVPLGAVNPNAAPIAGDVGYPAADGLTTTYRYYDNASTAIALEITNVLAKLPAGFFGANQTGTAVVIVNPASEKTVRITDGVGRGIIDASLDSSDVVVTWNISEHDDYDVAEDLLKTKNTNALGNTWTSYTDALSRNQITEDSLGYQKTTEFDANGNRVKTRDANGVGLDCLFDARNRDYSCTDTQGDNTTKVFDKNNNVTSVSDAKSKTITSVFDSRDRLTSSTDRINATTQYTFDDNNNMLTVEDAQNKITTYEYSKRNELIKTTYPDHVNGTVVGDLDYGITECELDEAGRKLLCTDQKGSMVQYEYDLVSRMTTRNYFSLGADPLVDTPDNADAFAYDLASRLLSGYKDEYNNTVTYSYDDIGRVDTQSLSYLAKQYDVQNTFDVANRLSSYTYPDGTSITNQFTVRNKLDTQYIGVDLVADYDYDIGQRETRREFGNGIITNRTYGRSDNLPTAIDVVGKTNLSVSYTYDPNKNVLTETRGGNMSGTSFTVTYDDQDRAKTWTRTNGIDSQTWNLSDVGDWISTTKNGVLQNRTHTAAHEIDSIGGVAVTHDANGNMTVDEAGNIYTWDKDNHLVKIQDSGLVTLAEYAYDAFGSRIAKTKSGTTTVFVHKAQQIICEYNSTSLLTNPSRVYVFSNGYIDDPVLAIDSSSNWFYHHVNRQFNLYGITDDTGAISEMYAYDVYGK